METKKKCREVKLGDTFEILDSIREEEDRKGGGLLILYRKGRGISLCKIATNNKDDLHKNENWEMGSYDSVSLLCCW